MDEKCQKILDECSIRNSFWSGIKISDVNQRNSAGNTPLHTIARRQQLEPVKILIENGADVNAIGEFGMTPLFFACSGNSVEVVEYLLKNGADPSIKNDWGLTARDSSLASKDIIELIDQKLGTYVSITKFKKKKEKGDKYTKKGKKP